MISGRSARHLVIVYAVVDDALSTDFLLGDSLEVFIRREDAERFSGGAGDVRRSPRSCSKHEVEAGG